MQSGRCTTRVPKFLASFILFLLPFFTSCHGTQPATIAVIPRTTALLFWEGEHAGAEAAAAHTGYHIYWNAPTSEDDVEKQISMMERMVNKKIKGLVLAPDQSLALMTPVRRALANGIPTVIVGSPLSIPPGHRLSYILNNEQETGQMAAERIGFILHGKGTIAVVGINPNVTGMIMRQHAFEENISAHWPGISIVEKRIATFNSAQAQQAVEEIVQSHPNLDAVLALNSMATRGTYFAISRLHLLHKVKIVGCDQEIMAPLITGEIDSVIVENTYEMGYRAVQFIAAENDGKSVPDVIRLSPTLVTKQNLDSPAVSRLLSMQWEPKS